MNPIETIQALLAAWEARDLEAAARLLADDFVLTCPAPVPLDRQAWLGFQFPASC